MRATKRRIDWATKGWLLAAAVLSCAFPALATTGDDTCVLIRKGLHAERITLVRIAGSQLTYVDEQGNGRTIDLDRCLGVYDPAAQFEAISDGLLALADGQRLPGHAISNEAASEEVVAWSHLWLGRMNVPLGMVQSMRLRPDVQVLEPGDTDQVQLVNGDLIKGFVVTLGDPISLEVDGETGPQVIDVPIERTAAVSMVTPDRAARGRRVWFRDGTVLDVSTVRVESEGALRVESPLMPEEGPATELSVDQVAAILFDPSGMIPLAALSPSRMSGPDFRYTLPAPHLTDPDAPLGMAAIEYRGPLVVHYATPSGVRRFAAEARLPLAARTWADFELVLRDDDRVVFRTRLDREHPSASINIPLEGAELTIELTEGRHGPVQDVLLLDRAIFSRAP